MTQPSDQEQWDALERRYRAEENDGPPELIDQAVLNKAHLAVETESEAKTNRVWGFGWVSGLTTVGVMVLGVSLFLQLQNEQAYAPAKTEIPLLRVTGDADRTEADDAAANAPLRQKQSIESMSMQNAAPAAASADSMAQPVQQSEPPSGILAEQRSRRAAGITADPTLANDSDEGFAVRKEADSGPWLPPAEVLADPDLWLQWMQEQYDSPEPFDRDQALDVFQKYWPDHEIPDDFLE